MSVVPGPVSQDAVFKLAYASPALQCTAARCYLAGLVLCSPSVTGWLDYVLHLQRGASGLLHLYTVCIIHRVKPDGFGVLLLYWTVLRVEPDGFGLLPLYWTVLRVEPDGFGLLHASVLDFPPLGA